MKLWAWVMVFAAGTALGQTEAAEQMRFADGLFQRGFYEDAAQEYRRYISENPNGEELLNATYRLGEAEYAQKRLDAALEAFQRVDALPGDALLKGRAALRKGELLYRLKRLDEAVAALESVVAREGMGPDVRPGALYYLAKARYDRDAFDGARRALEQLLTEYPGHALAPFGAYQLGFVYLGAGDPAGAATAFTKAAGTLTDPALQAECRFRAAEAYDAAGLYPDALSAYEALRSQFPNTEFADKAAYGAAYAQLRAGNPSQAIQLARAYLDTNPEGERGAAVQFLLANALVEVGDNAAARDAYVRLRDNPAGGAYRERAQFALAWAAYEAGDLEGARTEANRLRFEYPDSSRLADTLFLLGQIEQGAGDLEAALSAYEDAAAGPSGAFSGDAAFKAAEVQALLGQYEPAAAGFAAFIASYPDHPLVPDARIRSADARFLSADFANAAGDYEAILASNPDSAVAEEARYRLALAKHNGGDKAGAAEQFQALLANHPDSKYAVDARVRLGEQLLADGGDGAKAESLFRAALDGAPEGPLADRAWRGLGTAQFEQGNEDGAAAAFDRVLEHYPDLALTPSVYAWLGQYWVDREAYDKAARSLELLLRLHPEYPGLGDARFALADAYAQRGETDKARPLFEAIHDGGGNAALRAAYRLGSIAADGGRADDAIALFEEAAGATGDDTGAQARFAIGELLAQREDWSGAARNFMLVGILYNHPELTPEALWQAAAAYDRMEERPKAREVLAEIIADFPNHGRAAAAKALMDTWGTQ